MKRISKTALFFALIFLLQVPAYGSVSSSNVPLDSPVYQYLDKLAAFGLFTSDFKGIRPITKSEAARLLREAETNLGDAGASPLVASLVSELRTHLHRELAVMTDPAHATPFNFNPVAAAMLRYVYLDGEPRSYERQVHDPGGEGIFGVGAGLRPANPPGTVALQRGSEGTPLFENNEGVRYSEGHSLHLRFTSELDAGKNVTFLAEPMFLTTDGILRARLNKGYVKLGSGGVELEVGRDANWLGFGERGAITLSNNAQNFDLIKLSSPEPLDAGFLGKFKYALIFSRFDRVSTPNGDRRPWFYAIKVSLKPDPSLEIGLNLGRQQGGPGVSNTLRDNLQGIVGGTHKDNSNSLGGVEFRWRIPSLRNSEVYAEFSGEDAAKFWPFVESYLAGIFVPRLTDDGRNDLRFEYFLGNRILYTHGQFTEGYVYEGLPIGHAQGGATQDFFLRFRHWFSARENLGMDYAYTTRGNLGRLAGQALERKHAARLIWNRPLSERLDMRLTCGIERINNLNLVDGIDRTNSLAAAELLYSY